jgi:phosphatidylglycerol:prolipoprotein diacylglycerol transferase
VLRRDRFPFWKAADMAGFAIPIGLGFGRMGCLLAGCCYGLRSDGGLALSFPGHSPASEAQFKAGLLHSASEHSLRVLPTQVFESAMSFGIAAFCLLWLHGRKRYDGQVFVAFLGLYAAGRFLLELLRDDDRGGLGSLSTSQLIGVALVALAVAIHVRRSRAAATAPA